jgi:hypothetical protein
MKVKDISSTSQNDYQDDKILIFVSFQTFPMKKILINKDKKISSIFGLFPNGDKIVFFHGQIISQDFCFSEYKFENNDRIAIVLKEHLDLNSQIYWTTITKADEEKKFQISKLKNDPIMKKLCAISQDLVAFKVENQLKPFMKMIQNYEHLNKSQSLFNKSETNLDFLQNCNEPNTETLPILWD